MEVVGVGTGSRRREFKRGDFGIDVFNYCLHIRNSPGSNFKRVFSKRTVGFGFNKINGAGDNIIAKAGAVVSQNFVKNQLAEIIAVGF